MASDRKSTWLIDDVAEFLASAPSHAALLAYRPSKKSQARFDALLAKTKSGALSADEEWELSQFEHLEMLIQAIKARLRPHRTVAS
jgi:exonuclease VII large subunit